MPDTQINELIRAKVTVAVHLYAGRKITPDKTSGTYGVSSLGVLIVQNQDIMVYTQALKRWEAGFKIPSKAELDSIKSV